MTLPVSTVGKNEVSGVTSVLQKHEFYAEEQTLW